jgi:hypothetical protein
MQDGTYIQIGCIGWQGEILTLLERLVVEVRSHIVRDRHYERRYLGKVTLVAVGRVKELEFYHMAIVAAAKRKDVLSNIYLIGELIFSHGSSRLTSLYTKEASD